MDCRVKPGNDDVVSSAAYESNNRCTSRRAKTPATRRR
jgi:hypothetical protein